MKLPELKKKSISIGYNGIDIFDENEIDEMQIGYSRLPTGESLIGTKNGDWIEGWIVIGSDSSCGDPIFIDTSASEFPVYTAVHGEGTWEPDLISKTYDGFIQIIEKLEKLATDREYPTKLEKKPMTQEEFDEFISFVSDKGDLEETFFWELMVADEESGIGPEI